MNTATLTQTLTLFPIIFVIQMSFRLKKKTNKDNASLTKWQ